MEFKAYHAAHWAALAVAAAVIFIIVGQRERLRQPSANRAARRSLAALLAGSEAALQISYAIGGGWDVYSLPFELCSITLWLSAVLLLTGNRKLYEVSFFLGTLGATQALLTPNLSATFPEFGYFHFFIAHIAIVAANVYMTVVERLRPTFASVLRALAWLHVLAIPAALANLAFGTNFMYLARKPNTASLLDLLGPWPWYLLQLEVVAFLLCLALLGLVRLADRLAGSNEAYGGLKPNE